jgi:hypothetical protein
LHVYERHFDLLDKYYLAVDNKIYSLWLNLKNN